MVWSGRSPLPLADVVGLHAGVVCRLRLYSRFVNSPKVQALASATTHVDISMDEQCTHLADLFCHPFELFQRVVDMPAISSARAMPPHQAYCRFNEATVVLLSAHQQRPSSLPESQHAPTLQTCRSCTVSVPVIRSTSSFTPLTSIVSGAAASKLRPARMTSGHAVPMIMHPTKTDAMGSAYLKPVALYIPAEMTAGQRSRP